MKKSTIILSSGFILLFIFASSTFAQLKFGYLDSQEILARLKETKDVEGKLNELYKSWEQEAQNMQLALKKKQDDFEAKSLMLTDKAKAERTQEIQAGLAALQQFEQEKLGPQGELFKERQKLLQPIVKKIQDQIDKIGEAEGFDYIFDAANGNIVYVSKSQVNLTDRIIKALETQSSGTASTSEKTK